MYWLGGSKNWLENSRPARCAFPEFSPFCFSNKLLLYADLHSIEYLLIFQSVNELFDRQGWNCEIVGGHIGTVEVSIPWIAMMTEDSHLNITNLCVTLRPISRIKDGTSVLESMWSSMSSSMQLAEECIKKEDVELNQIMQETSAMEGLERVAQTIDNGSCFGKFNRTMIRFGDN